MAITDINISEQLETGAPSIKYRGKEGPRPPMQSQEEMMIAKQIWEAMGPEEQGQFSNFDEFFRSGIWKQILQQAQQDDMQEQGGIGSLGPRNMEQPMQMANRMPAASGGSMEQIRKLMQGLRPGAVDSMENIRETIDTPQGIETLDETETMQVAGGGLRGWKAQEIAEDLAYERYGREFYDLSHVIQMELYNEALDIWDSRGE